MNGLAWLGFWIFLAVFVVCDTWLFSKGYNAYFWSHKQPEEKELRKIAIARARITPQGQPAKEE